MSDVAQPETRDTGTKTPKHQKEQNASLWADAFRQLRRRPTVILPVLFLLTVFSMALFPSLWTSNDPNHCLTGDSINIGGPKYSSDHPFGFDVLGCDYYAKVIYGSRPSLLIAVGATLGMVIIGSLLGMLAGYFGGWVDAILSRITDIFFALPFLLGAIVYLTVVKDRSPWTIMSILVILGWTTVARLMRGSVIQSKQLDYVQAARALGASDWRLMFKHILPNAMAPVVVIATIALGGYVAAEATLSFLGVGLIPPTTSWGILISFNEPTVHDLPFLVIFPAVFVVGTVLSFILLGDALRDALDPKLR